MGVLRLASGSSVEYMPHVAAMLHSLLEHRGGLDLEAHYLHAPEASRADLDAMVAMVETGGGRLELHEIPAERIEGLKPIIRIPVNMWYRTFLPELLPDVDKILYLDADVIAVDSVEPLWAMDLDGNYVGAVTNVWERWNLDFVRSLELQRPYFNSGVLVMNLDLMRRDDATAKVLAYARAHERVPWGDQTALNVVLGARRLDLHPRWNCMNSVLTFEDAIEVFGEQAVREARENPALRHFEGPDANKPWHAQCTDAVAQAEYLRHRRATPWPEVKLDGRRRLLRLPRR